jgi:hypothetical protein
LWVGSVASRQARLACLVGLLVIGSLQPGCNRAHYRQQADEEAYGIIRDAANHPHWPLDRFQIDVNPRSRMFSPFAIDNPPMPPDDPVSHRYMHLADNRRGYPHWHDNGDTPFVENPAWLQALPFHDDGVVHVDMDLAIQLALVHSPDYQQELEELYLSALDVSFERFRFDAQFFAGYGAFYTSDGPRRPGSGGFDRSEFSLETVPRFGPIRMEKLSTTGAEMVVGLANSFIWQFSGPNTHDATTLLDFALLQPLLRGGGRARVMERLTIAERTLLANVRQMERYRREFYVEITTGRQTGSGPERRGGFFGGSGLEGFSGVGGGGFGRVGAGGGQGFAGGAGAPEAGGLIGLLQAQQNLLLQQSNIAALRNSVIQLDAFFQADRIDYFQVELARQALLNAQSRWLNASQVYESSLDDFKRDLGLPPWLPIQVDDNFLQHFNLIAPALVAEQNALSTLQQDLGDNILALSRLAEAAEPNAEQFDATLRRIVLGLDEAQRLNSRVISQLVPQVQSDIERLDETVPIRRRDLAQLRQKFATPDGSLLLNTPGETTDARAELSDITRNAFDIDQLIALPAELTRATDQLVVRLDEASQRLEQLRTLSNELLEQHRNLPDEQLDARLRDLTAPLPNQLRDLYGDLLELALLQARARTESITLEPIDLDWLTAFEIARQNRRDWMNARANLVDAWRLIEFNANDLQSEVDIVFQGDISNRGDNPLEFDDATGRLRAGVQIDAPLTRLSERNTYRQSLIEYDQARRSYYRFEDRIAQLLRDTIRRVELNQLNFELLRSAVRVSISQVELAQLRLQEPPRPAEENILGATTARDLVTALSDLLNAQTDFLSVWVNYEVLRRGLDLDLGTMQLDPYGGWIDPGPIRADGLLDEEPLEPPLPDDEELIPPAGATRPPAMLQVGHQRDGKATGEAPVPLPPLPRVLMQPPAR